MSQLIITGAQGYIGQAVVTAAQAAGFDVITLARRHATFAYDLADTVDFSALPAGAPIIHLAQQTRQTASEADVNAPALTRLRDWATANNSRLVFVSSQTARDDAPTLYGRDKAVAEALLRDAADAVIVRPGLVYGGDQHGLYGQLCHMVAEYRATAFAR